MSGLCHSPPLNQLALHRETKDERQIGQTKQVLVAMRNTQTYRNTKLRLIHKLSGIKWLEQRGFPSVATTKVKVGSGLAARECIRLKNR